MQLQGVVAVGHLEVVGGAVNSLCDQTERANHDLYLLVGHPQGGNDPFTVFHKEESITVIGLKIDDPSIDKIAKEVETAQKAAVVANKKNPGSTSVHRGLGTARGSHKPHSNRNSYDSRDFYNHGGFYQYNNQCGLHHGPRDGRDGYYSDSSYGSFQHNPTTNGQGQQSNQNNFPPKPMIGWFGRG